MGEALALHYAGQESALLPPRVVTPPFLLLSEDDRAAAANPTQTAAIWADVLLRTDISRLKGLFPSMTPDRDFNWALYTGSMIQGLRNTLADGGYRIADVVSRFADTLEESDRWQDLARLETDYLERLAQLGLKDKLDIMINRALDPVLPTGVQRIVVAAVPDPTPLLVRAMENLARQVPIVILIHAPESLAERFDDWGRPIPEKWCQIPIDVPEPEANIILAGSPASQSSKVLGLIAGEVHRFGPNDIAIGVPDTGIVPFLEADLADRGIPSFDPSGKPLTRHPLYQLLEAYAGLVGEGSYSSLSALLRHADLLEHLRRRNALSSQRLLEELDTFQNRHLPTGWEDIDLRLLPQSNGAEAFPPLAAAVNVLRQQVEVYRAGDVQSAVRTFLQTVYEEHMLNPNNPADRDFVEVAEAINTVLAELSTEAMSALRLGPADTMTLLLHRLGEQRYTPEHEGIRAHHRDTEGTESYALEHDHHRDTEGTESCTPKHEGTRIDLEGWLELHWDDAPFLIVTGMNDGSVPDSRIGDVFLPDTLRRQLGLRHDADRLARDAYLMTAMIESRRAAGRACFVVGKTTADGDPAKPSRLLFHCDNDDLPQRAQRLFGEPQERRDNYPATMSFLLDASPPPDLPPGRLDIRTVRVTEFRDYLACPFRFYLAHVLGMEEMSDEKREMDALDFGSLVHDALHRVARDPAMRDCRDEAGLRDFLWAEAEKWIEARFGAPPPLQIVIQLEAAKQRLAAAARVQTTLVEQGWEILHDEEELEIELAGIRLRGRIDRIDRHRDTGAVRVLDYKTSDNAVAPEQAHLATASPDAPGYANLVVNRKERRWADLQLPLYRLLVASRLGPAGAIEVGYFDLPKAAGHTGVSIWETLDENVMDSARVCAEGVVQDIRERRFWPPAAKPRNDSFGRLFPVDAARCVNAAALNRSVTGARE